MSGSVQDVRAPAPATRAGTSRAVARVAIVAVFAGAWYASVRATVGAKQGGGEQRSLSLAVALLEDRVKLAGARAKAAASLLGDDPRLKVLLGEELDERTVKETFDDLRARTGASVMMALTPTGRVSAVVGAEELLGLDLSKTSAIVSASGAPAGAPSLWGWHDRVLAVSAGEIHLGPTHVATIVVGMQLGDADLEAVERLTGAAGAIVVGDKIVARTARAPEGAVKAALALPGATAARLAGDHSELFARSDPIGEAALPARAVWLRKIDPQEDGLGLQLLLFLPVIALVALAAVGLGKRISAAAPLVLLALMVPRGAEAQEVEEAEPVAEEEVSWASPPEPAPAPAPVVGPIGFSLLLDVGLYAPIGSGLGVIRDVGDRAAPALADRYTWVFLGDLLSTAVNTRGEPADLGDLPGVTRADSIHSGDALGFIVNQVSLGAAARLGETFAATAVFDFLPRSGVEFSLGDTFAVDLAQLEWRPDDEGRWLVVAGKIDPVFGIEYRERRPNKRFGITPSLIARYTTGTPVGVRGRVKLGDERVLLALALTNGSTGIETFHFSSDTDTNSAKTVSGRAGLVLPLDELGGFLSGARFELGLSGLFGAQDHAEDSATAMWAAGIDVAVRGVSWALKAELMRARAPGRPEDRAYGLELDAGGYVEAEWLFHPMFGVMVRGEARDATVNLGDERIYITRSWRVTAGARAVINPNLVIKAEYLKNGEFGLVPEFANDVFTSSLVLSL